MIPPLYAILDVDTVTKRGWKPADVCLAWLSAGVRLVQLRAKTLASGAFLELADEIVAIGREPGARIIINDRADIAAMAGAAGVHLGQDDLSPADARTILAGSAIVGLSTHDRAQAASGAREPISYLAIGPVYATATKATGCDALGPTQVREAAAVTAAAGLPLVAIGGITLARAGEVLAAGADSVAVISGLLTAPTLAGIEECARAWVRQTGAG